MGDWNGVPGPATTNHPGQRPAAAGCPAPTRVGLGDWYGGPLPDSKLVWITSQRAPLKSDFQGSYPKEHLSKSTSLKEHAVEPHSNQQQVALKRMDKRAPHKEHLTQRAQQETAFELTVANRVMHMLGRS